MKRPMHIPSTPGEAAALEEGLQRPVSRHADAIMDRVVRAHRKGRPCLARLLLGLLYDEALTEIQQRRLRRAWALFDGP